MINSHDILKASILIVDDQEANICLLREMLQEAGYVSISSTRDPGEVAALHRKNRYSLIMLDLQMPVMDGFAVMERLKEIEVHCYLPVLVITAQPDQKLRALKAGAKDFISKPFDLVEVLIRVHNMLEVRLLHLEAEARTEKAEGRFLEAQKMGAIGHLAAGVAHDFNNILAVIMGYSELIASDIKRTGHVLEHNQKIKFAAERAIGLTRQLLVFSRKQTIQPVVLNLEEEVRRLEQMLRRLIGETVELTIAPSKDSGRIKADSGYIGQVLMNLVVNARDAMPNGGKISVATSNVTLDLNYQKRHPGTLMGDYVMLSVSDTGIGMTEDVKAHLFEAFFTTKAIGKGTGLGLATCQTIVRQCGGHIDVYSEAGNGTTFKVYFPRVDLPLDAAIGIVPTGATPSGTETLLVVEDDPSVRHLAREILEAQGYKVLSATNGREAMHTVDAHQGPPIHLVVTDVIMPLMGGKVMADWLKITNPELKILFTSGYTDDAIVNHGVLEPGIDFLPKPYTPSTLARKVREMLDSPGKLKSAVTL